MAQNVPPIEWTDNALVLREFVFRYWCATGHAPNYRNVHEATGLVTSRDHPGVQRAATRHRRRCRPGHAELQPGEGAAVLVVPIASRALHRRQVPQLYRLCERSSGGVEHAAVPRQGLPARVVLRVLPRADHHHLEHVRGAQRPTGGRAVARHHQSVGLEQHRYGAHVRFDELRHRRRPCRALRAHDGDPRCPRDLDQAKEFVRGTGEQRMHDYHWPPGRMDPAGIIDGLRQLGVDVSPWGE